MLAGKLLSTERRGPGERMRMTLAALRRAKASGPSRRGMPKDLRPSNLKIPLQTEPNRVGDDPRASSFMGPPWGPMARALRNRIWGPCPKTTPETSNDGPRTDERRSGDRAVQQPPPVTRGTSGYLAALSRTSWPGSSTPYGSWLPDLASPRLIR